MKTVRQSLARHGARAGATIEGRVALAVLLLLAGIALGYIAGSYLGKPEEKTVTTTVTAPKQTVTITQTVWATNQSTDLVDYIDTTVEEAREIMNSPNVTMLDVRSQDEYDSGHIAGAKLIPVSELEERIDELSKDKAIIVYCRSGVRSRRASEILVQHGFEEVYNMLGGINAWTGAGFPIVSDRPNEP